MVPPKKIHSNNFVKVIVGSLVIQTEARKFKLLHEDVYKMMHISSLTLLKKLQKTVENVMHLMVIMGFVLVYNGIHGM